MWPVWNQERHVHTKSKKVIRQEHILAALEANPARRVNELSQELGVSSETIRRDLSELDQAGKISRTYGGAVRSSLVLEPALAVRIKTQVKERQRIAKEALAHLGAANSLFISGGATALHFARLLRTITRPMVVITPAYSVAIALAPNPLIQVIQLPGVVNGEEGLVCGPETIAAIERFRAPVAVLSASGIDASGLSEALPAAAQIYTAMITHAERTLMLADATKFNKRALCALCTWGRHLHLITDAIPPERLLTAIRGAGAAVSVAV